MIVHFFSTIETILKQSENNQQVNIGRYANDDDLVDDS